MLSAVSCRSQNTSGNSKKVADVYYFLFFLLALRVEKNNHVVSAYLPAVHVYQPNKVKVDTPT
jgi:hypothetical protein